MSRRRLFSTFPAVTMLTAFAAAPVRAPQGAEAITPLPLPAAGQADPLLANAQADLHAARTAELAAIAHMDALPDGLSADHPDVLASEDVLAEAGDRLWAALEAITAAPALVLADVLVKADALHLAIRRNVFISTDIPEGKEGKVHELLAWSLVNDLLRLADAPAGGVA
jgi:hypothetical protein